MVFKRKKKGGKRRQTNPDEVVLRVPLPKPKQVLGQVEIRLGYGKSRVRCADGKTRLCRVPGALKRRLWVRPNDIVLVEPWELGGDQKGNIVYKYRKNQVSWLKDNGHLKELIELEEF